MSNTIKIKKYSDVIEEMVANATITPGMLVEEMSTGKVRAHATAGGNVLPMFALENELAGKGIDDDYAATDPVQVWIPNRGDVVNAILYNGETAVIGSFLSSQGNGTLKVHDPIVDSAADVETIYYPIVGVAIEAVDMSGSSGVDPSGRIKVRII